LEQTAASVIEANRHRRKLNS